MVEQNGKIHVYTYRDVPLMYHVHFDCTVAGIHTSSSTVDVKIRRVNEVWQSKSSFHQSNINPSFIYSSFITVQVLI
jgi:hypothetical protein